MKFCPDCDSKLSQNPADVASPGICPRCSPELITKKKVFYGMNQSGKTKRCSKGCGADIYWDELFKSESGKFIPMDALTDEPHNCNTHVGDSDVVQDYFPSGASRISRQSKNEDIKNAIPFAEEIAFDINKINQFEINADGIIHEIVQGHKDKSLAIIHYENKISPEPEKIPLDSMSDVLSNGILKGLKACGFRGLLPFQEESIRSILKGKNSIISAPTGSGKTEAFIIPILQKILENPIPGVAVLLVYPLNALIDDQVSKVSDLIEKCGMSNTVAAYSIHGGQSTSYKDQIIEESSSKAIILATNFDFINYHLILQDKKWNLLFKNARILVMDEAHSYTSFHGSNVYHVLKRMKKHMNQVQFIGSSATLDNSKEFFSSMFDLPADSLSCVESKLGRKHNMHLFFIMPRKFGQRTTMEMLTSICFKNNTKQLVFGNTHNDAEFLAMNVEDANKDIQIQIHRGGLDQTDRKLYESQMKAGELDALSCTPTLEMGIDIGHVDVAISAFKNEYDSFVQRIGRAGRKGQKSYAICVFDPDDATCHYFARHISEYLNQEHIVQINKENPIITDKHAASTGIEQHAAMETNKSQFFDFANSVNLRGTSGEIAIYFDSKKIGTRDIPAGYYQLHQKAIYHFNKVNYEVAKITKTQNGANVNLIRSDDMQKRTIPIVKTSIIKKSENNAINREIIPSKQPAHKIFLRLGLIELDRTITGYLKGNYNDTADRFETHDGNSIPSWKNFSWKSKHSAVSITLPQSIVPKKSNSDGKNPITLDSKIHTVTHVLVNACKIITKSESNDIDSYYEDGTIYIYDNTSDGYNGCSEIIFDSFEKILQTSNSLLSDCDCPTDKTQKRIVDAGEEWGGCPKCTFTTNYCQTKNKDLSKSGAKEFFSNFKHT